MTDNRKTVGRPKAEKPQDKRVTVRMTQETFEKFESYCETQKSQSQKQFAERLSYSNKNNLEPLTPIRRF